MINLTFNGCDVLKEGERRISKFAPNSRSSETRDGQKSRVRGSLDFLYMLSACKVAVWQLPAFVIRRYAWRVCLRKEKYSSASFEASKRRVVFPEARISSIEGPYRISFKFRMLAPSCILLAVTFNSTYRRDFVSIELFADGIRYSFGFGSRFESVISPILPAKQTLSDMRWHSLLIYQNTVNGEHHMLIDNKSSVMDSVGGRMARLEGQLFLDGLPPGVPLSPRFYGLADVTGFLGCICSLRIGDEHLDVFVDAEETVGVTKGSAGRCYNLQFVV